MIQRRKDEVPIDTQFEELVERFGNLRISLQDDGQQIVEGILTFCATFKQEVVYDEYDIQVVLPQDYPSHPPKAFETGHRISPFYHKFKDSSLCLGAPLRVRAEFSKRRTLLSFVECLLLPYLFTHSIVLRGDPAPYGEYSHHGEGILEFYEELLGFSDPVKILRMLAVPHGRTEWRHAACPCGSGRLVRACHKNALKLISRYSSKSEIEYDVSQILKLERVRRLGSYRIPKVFRPWFNPIVRT